MTAIESESVTIEYFSGSIAMHESFGSVQLGTAKTFIANYRSAAASFLRALDLIQKFR